MANRHLPGPRQALRCVTSLLNKARMNKQTKVRRLKKQHQMINTCTLRQTASKFFPHLCRGDVTFKQGNVHLLSSVAGRFSPFFLAKPEDKFTNLKSWSSFWFFRSFFDMNFDFPSIETGSFQACSIFAVVNAQNIANHFLHYTHTYIISYLKM